MDDTSPDEFLKSLDADAENEAAPRQGKRYHKPNGLDEEWRELELIQFTDIQPRLDGRPLVKSFLERGQISVVYGETGCGKTFLGLDLALHVAAGFAWFGRKVEQGAVVYIAAEAGRSIINRVAAWGIKHGLNGADIPFAVVPSSLDLCHPKAGDVDRLIEEIHQSALGQIVLIVVDTLSRALAGGNENAPDDMGAFVRSLDRLREEWDCHIAVIQDSGKDQSRGPRGHSLLRCAVDTEIEVARDHSGGISTATVTKQRDNLTDGHIDFRLSQLVLGTDQDGELVTSCVVDPILTPQPKQHPQTKLSPAQKRALELLVEAIIIQGKIPPENNHIPANTECVTEGLWRDYCCQGSISSSNKPNAKQKAFKRAAEVLLAKGCIGKWGDQVWGVAR
jgi:KaiC/GvpD/RAD55 family RecA-like ATPase